MDTPLTAQKRAPLSENSVLRSASFEETSSFLRTEKGLALRLPGCASSASGFWFAMNMIALPRTYLYYAENRPMLRQERLAPYDFDYVIQVPTAGAFELRAGHRSLQCKAGGAAVVSPTDPLDLVTSDGCKRLALRVRRQALTDHLATLLGDPPREPLVFERVADAPTAGGSRLVNAIRYAAQGFECLDSMNGSDVVTSQFEQFIMTLLLMTQPNNYSAALNRRDNGVRPRDVKRAVDYIHANLATPISLADLVTASGVPGRTLYQHFQDFLGTSPTGYVKRARYQKVREELIRSNGAATVTEVAGRWGLSHMGRFSAEYRRRFGELPSATVRRRRPF